MKKIIILIVMIITSSLSSYSFQMDTVNFDKVIKKNDKESKEYTIVNNSFDLKEYELYIEETPNNIKIEPKKFKLKPNDEQIVNLTIEGTKRKGEYSYYFVVIDKNLSEKKSNAAILNKKIRIKQKYSIE